MSGLLKADGLTKGFDVGGGRTLWAVRDVSFSLELGEALAVVGESGSGKTTLARLLMVLTRPTAGRVHFGNVELTSLRPRELRRMRPRAQMVFQDPRDALNPRMRIVDSIAEPLRVAEPTLRRAELRARVEEAAELVHFPGSHLERRPHELSAGEQQRASLARAVITRPELLMLDEPTSMLDASLRAGMVRTFAELQEALQLSLILISHDFVSVASLANRIAVMYLGELVELGPARQVLRDPLHPYTRALLSAVPIIDRGQPEPVVRLEGEIPSPVDRPAGCALADRCPFVDDRSRTERPSLVEIEPGHHAACFVSEKRRKEGTWEPVDTPGRWLSEQIERVAVVPTIEAPPL